MAFTDIIVEKKEPAVWITMNKPQRKNAMGLQTMLDLWAVMDDIERDVSVVAVVFKGAGDSFCAGMDLKDAQTRTDPQDTLAFKRLADRVFDRIENLNKVTIAMIHGIAMAGGLELAMLCDFMIVDEAARIGDGHIRTGIIPNGGGTQRLPRLIGIRKAKELLYTGEFISGTEAERIGLANKAVPADKLIETVESYISKIADKPPLSLAAMKVIVNNGLEASLHTGLQFEAQTVRGVSYSEDTKEALAAFAQKRKPVYKGR
jgi:enoyl-CoA hydratase/carnithine racemase